MIKPKERFVGMLKFIADQSEVQVALGTGGSIWTENWACKPVKSDDNAG